MKSFLKCFLLVVWGNCALVAILFFAARDLRGYEFGNSDEFAPRSNSVAWMARISDAQEAAAVSGKLVLVHFSSFQGEPCRRMDAEVFTHPQIAALLAQHFVPVKLNAAAHLEETQKYGVSGVPSDLILDATGKVIHRREGGIGAARYAEYLTWIISQFFSPEIKPEPLRKETMRSAISFAEIPVTVENEPEISLRSEPEMSSLSIPETLSISARETVAIPLALDGFCPVTLADQEKWVAGNPQFYAMFRGEIYRFANENAREQFRKNPEKFAPANDGNDIVMLVERQQVAAGSRRFGVWYRNRMFLFAARESLESFAKRPDFFAEIALHYETVSHTNAQCER